MENEDCCAMSDHFMHAFCTGELCSGRVSVKLFLYYTFLKIYSSKIRPEISTAQSTKGDRAAGPRSAIGRAPDS